MQSSSHTVTLLVYDLSNGMAKNMSSSLLGMQIDGIWHTGIVVYGKEYYYGGGICTGQPKRTPYGTPVEELPLGETEIPEELFMDFLRDINPNFTADRYDLFQNNCNNFTDAACNFLLGHGIPEHITGLPSSVLNTPLGKMLKPMIDNMQKQAIKNSNPLFNRNEAGFERAGEVDPQSTYYSQPAGAGYGQKEPEGVVEMNSMEEYAAALSKDEAFIIDCFSYTCPPCMKIKPIYAQLAKDTQIDHPNIKFYTCNTQGPGGMIASTHQVRAIPTFLGFYKGTVIDRFEGANEQKLRTMINTLKSKIPKTPKLQLFNPEKRELYRFSDKFDLAIGKIKTLTASNPTYQTRDNTLFNKFAENPAQRMKDFSLIEKKDLIRWTIDILEPSKEELIPVWDFWRNLLSEDPWIANYCHDFGSHFEKIISDLSTKSGDFCRPSRVFALRALTNCLNVHEGRFLFKKNLQTINEIVFSAFTKYREDKQAVIALTWLSYNIAACQKEVELKDEDAMKYVNLMCENIEKEKDERIVHGSLLTLLHLCWQKPARISAAKSRKLEGYLESFATSMNDALQGAINDLSVVLGQ